MSFGFPWIFPFLLPYLGVKDLKMLLASVLAVRKVEIACWISFYLIHENNFTYCTLK